MDQEILIGINGVSDNGSSESVTGDKLVAVDNSDYSPSFLLSKLIDSDVISVVKTGSTANPKVAFVFKDNGLMGNYKNIEKIIYTQYLNMSISFSPSVIEAGESTFVLVTCKADFNGELLNESDITNPVYPFDSMKLDNGVCSAYASLSETHTYSFSLTYKTVTKTITGTITAQYPIYFGATYLSQLSAIPSDFTKYSGKKDPNGDYAITLDGAKYVWLCIPNTMSFAYIMLNHVATQFSLQNSFSYGGTTYDAYRSDARYDAGEYLFQVDAGGDEDNKDFNYWIES